MTSSKILSAVAVALMLSVCCVGLIADGSDASATTINLVPGQTYQYTPTFSSGLSPTVTVSASSSSQPSSSSTYAATSGYASVSSGTVSVTVPSSYSGSYYYVTIKATTTAPTQTAYQEIAFKIVSAFALSGASSAVAVVGSSFSYSVTATSGWTVQSYSISPSLPSGLSFDTATGAISGTPSAASAATAYTVTGTTVVPSVTASCTVSLTVESAISVTVPSTVYAVEGGSNDAASITVTGGSGVTYEVSAVSGGMSSSKVQISSTGAITVTASSGDAGTHTVTVIVHSTNQPDVTKTFSLVVSSPLAFTSSPTAGFYVIG